MPNMSDLRQIRPGSSDLVRSRIPGSGGRDRLTMDVPTQKFHGKMCVVVPQRETYSPLARR